MNPLFCALAFCRSEGVSIDFIYNSTDSHNYYYLSFEQEQQPESGGFLFYTDLVNAEEKTWEFHSVIIPQIGRGFICFPARRRCGGSAMAVKVGLGQTER